MVSGDGGSVKVEVLWLTVMCGTEEECVSSSFFSSFSLFQRKGVL